MAHNTLNYSKSFPLISSFLQAVLKFVGHQPVYRLQRESPSSPAATSGLEKKKKSTEEREQEIARAKRQLNNSLPQEYKTTLLVGPLWDDEEAEKVGTAIAASFGAEYTGEWRVLVEGQMSIVEIKCVLNSPQEN